ncbi:hypothetical protein N0V90_004577 [Kalmusia sp. IMI 367209]|nr:hypothetical protein N0V90_004577 [Kalmusia sp. IMI 367209]
MFGLKNIYASSKNWTQQLNTRRIQKQQWYGADQTELRHIARSSSGYTQDTAYHPQPMRNDEAEIVDADQKSRNSSGSKRYTSGWRFGAINCAISASIVFLINLIVTIWGSVHNKSQGNVLFEGDCERARKLNTGLHFLINLLSTILLSSSNYCMQCLSAPTRKEIDAAHAKGKWLDIGVQSVHNLRNINTRRTVVWFLLGLSSLPLHLLPNAVRMMHEKSRNNSLDRLTNLDCIREYSEPIQSNRRNVLLVSADDKMPSPNATANGVDELYAYSFFSAHDASESSSAVDSYDWMCTNDTNYDSNMNYIPCSNLVEGHKNAPDDWNVGGRNSDNEFTPSYPVEYCLSEKAEPRCKIQFTRPIAIWVTILNVFKAALIFYTAFGTKEDPLMTMGDAVASFLERKDETTKGMCLLSVRDVKSHKGYFPAGPKQWTGKRRRWKDVTSRTRRIVTFTMLFITLITVAGLLGYGVNQLPDGTPHSVAGFAAIGYGAIDARTIMSFDTSYSTIQYILLANLPQPILSFLYFSYNGLFTAMLLGYEWVSYAHRRKGLRVSRAPQGAQRSTYFLQLPYRFAMPLMAMSGVLHWLVSQSIFLVSVDVYDWDGSHTTGVQGDWKSTGYSPISIFTTVILGLVMTLAAAAFGFIPFKEGMNVAGSCSAAISAACHDLEEVDGHEAARGRLQWGVVGVNADGVGHCAFSTTEVEMPKVGQVYAGKIDRVEGIRARRHGVVP